jgi:hypothetical protein
MLSARLPCLQVIVSVLLALALPFLNTHARTAHQMLLLLVTLCSCVPACLPACLQLFITIGILVAQCINYGNQNYEWGWRLNLGLAGESSLISRVTLCFAEPPAASEFQWCSPRMWLLVHTM